MDHDESQPENVGDYDLFSIVMSFGKCGCGGFDQLGRHRQIINSVGWP